MSPYLFPGLDVKHEHSDLVCELTKYVAQSHCVTVSEVRSSTRKLKPKTARFICMYMLYKCTNLTYDTIGNYYGKDHSTVIHAVRKIGEEITLAGRHSLELNNYIKELKREFRLNELRQL